ncbi:ubiquitin-related modifier 1 [Neocloeon triangulifer]|uniref:ubiquitin-related modifier 1 n=1 Tax=Neocloeon triangulifer TaxID=2078957 RepID=UPI00286F87EA|nr:ubiquitin-related modifier 1 [Neocloeon triangulifer]
MSSDVLKISIHFSGGAEILFDNIKKHELSLQKDDLTWDLRRLISWIRDNKMKSRQELFAKGDSVRPGILVLVNDTDWDLLGQTDYELCNGDEVHFISTLHGG